VGLDVLATVVEPELPGLDRLRSGEGAA